MRKMIMRFYFIWRKKGLEGFQLKEKQQVKLAVFCLELSPSRIGNHASDMALPTGALTASPVFVRSINSSRAVRMAWFVISSHLSLLPSS